MVDSTQQRISQWMHDYVQQALEPERLEQMVEHLNATVVELVPRLADPSLRDNLAASTRSQARAFLLGLADDSPKIAVPDEAHELARTYARRGLDLRLLLETYRAGQQAGIEYITQLIAEEQLPYELERPVLIRLFERANTLAGVSVEVLTDTYTEERERGLRDVFTRRAEMVRAVLSGDRIDADEASALLGYRLQRNHIGYVLWIADAESASSVIRALDKQAHAIATGLGAAAVLTVPSEPRVLWAWAAVGEHVDLGVLHDLAPLDGDTRVRVALGSIGTGAAGFQSSHRESLAARRIAQSSTRTEWLTPYPEVELVSLVSADDEGMRAMIARELAGLAAADAHSARLRETLHAYLTHHRSPEAAARTLGVHKNTVRYRIQRAEEILGYPIDKHSLKLPLALECVRVLGENALPGDISR